MRFDLITIFPDFFRGPLDYGIVRRAREAGLIEIDVHDLRAFTHDRHRTVDDRPFGGGEGMVLKPEPLGEALQALEILPLHDRRENQILRSAQDDETESGTRVILLSAQGRPFTQQVARDMAKLERVVLICGRYEGVDERINEIYCDMELSI